LWQVSGRNDIPYNLRVQMDVYYVNYRNFWLDLWIIVKTIGVIISPKNNGAYWRGGGHSSELLILSIGGLSI
jgi:lipopolysaccharide/colanic/teichoic acid biosynthesis glycosyltransferase